jgi:hypothetical protein
MKASADGRWFEFKEGGMVEPGISVEKWSWLGEENGEPTGRGFKLSKT